ncbi:MAG: cobyrinate a,c-diamide synthase [Desulfamplus sp.]|nr:cobyrinate a,c-diamide synthase [Desulfamplus sp.]
MKGFVIAGTGSGSGKTTITLGILAYLLKLGYKVAPFKVGPDFIDPGHHRALTGKISHNLDSWMLSKEANQNIFAKGCQDADIAVVEGVMGLFDGYSGTSEAGSTAQMAKWLRLPVVLVVDAKSMARSAAAVVKGFENFDPDVEFAGVIFSKTGSNRHYSYLKEAVEANCRIRCLGHLPRTQEIAMPERHLGLVTSDEYNIKSDVVSKLIEMIDKNSSIKAMVENLPFKKTASTINSDSNLKVDADYELCIAVARDSAFCFYYQENIEALKRCGAKIVEFSPISSPNLPTNTNGIYLGGGYPELFAQKLSENRTLIDEIAKKSLQGLPIYAECGGFMYLCKEIAVVTEENILNQKAGLNIEPSKKRYPMVGTFAFSAVMSKKMRSLGYREITLTQDTILGKKGEVLRGHEFHYSSIEDEDITYKETHKIEVSNDSLKLKQVYQTTARDGQKINLNGYQINNTLGSYLHIHFDSMGSTAAQSFVDACKMAQSCCL